MLTGAACSASLRLAPLATVHPIDGFVHALADQRIEHLRRVGDFFGVAADLGISAPP